jgi:DNA-binding NarL/FixJ family response regulator
VLAASRTAVLFDPHPLWLEAVEGLLARLDVAVIEKTTRLEQALEAVERHHPDLLITEITTPDAADAGEAIRTAKATSPQLRVIVLSTHSEPRYVDVALAAGALAYVIKTAHREDLLTTIRQAFENSVFFARSGDLAAPSRAAPAAADNGAGDLTKREVEILRLVAEGRSNSEVAKALWVTEQTVKFHLSNIYRKLNVANRTQASRWAQTRGLFAAPHSGAD